MRRFIEVVFGYGAGAVAVVVYLGIFTAASWWPLACGNPWN